MDLQSNGGSITKEHVDKFDLKYSLVKIIKEVIKEEKINSKDEQVSFEDFTKDFKL